MRELEFGDNLSISMFVLCIFILLMFGIGKGCTYSNAEDKRDLELQIKKIEVCRSVPPEQVIQCIYMSSTTQ